MYVNVPFLFFSRARRYFGQYSSNLRNLPRDDDLKGCQNPLLGQCPLVAKRDSAVWLSSRLDLSHQGVAGLPVAALLVCTTDSTQNSNENESKKSMQKSFGCDLVQNHKKKERHELD